MARKRPDELRITDPRALAASLVELTPSATSHHLRALERWGVVERDSSSDGRERPWDVYALVLPAKK